MFSDSRIYLQHIIINNVLAFNVNKAPLINIKSIFAGSKSSQIVIKVLVYIGSYTLVYWQRFH